MMEKVAERPYWRVAKVLRWQTLSCGVNGLKQGQAFHVLTHGCCRIGFCHLGGLAASGGLLVIFLSVRSSPSPLCLSLSILLWRAELRRPQLPSECFRGPSVAIASNFVSLTFLPFCPLPLLLFLFLSGSLSLLCSFSCWLRSGTGVY